MLLYSFDHFSSTILFDHESSDVALQHPCSLLQSSVLLIFVDSSLNLMLSLTASEVTNCFISIDIFNSTDYSSLRRELVELTNLIYKSMIAHKHNIMRA